MVLPAGGATTKMFLSASGKMTVVTNAGTVGGVLDVTSDGVFKHYASNGSTAGILSFGGATRITGGVDGIVGMTNAAGTSFTALRLGPGTSSFPSIKRSSAVVQIRLGDDSALTGLHTSVLTFGSTGQIFLSAGSGSPESVVTAAVGSIYMRLDGGTSDTLYIKTSGTGNTGWTAK